MDDLIEFLRARLDEDEAVARAAPPGPWIGTDGDDIGAWSVYDADWLIASAKVYTHNDALGGKRGPGYIDASATTAHIARHDPARALAEVEAKRAILVEHARYSLPDGAEMNECRTCGGVNEAWPCPTLRLLALPYAAHPDYRPEWAPTA